MTFATPFVIPNEHQRPVAAAQHTIKEGAERPLYVDRHEVPLCEARTDAEGQKTSVPTIPAATMALIGCSRYLPTATILARQRMMATGSTLSMP